MEMPKLGKRPDETAGRDAVHVPIVPVEAGEKLWPGTPVAVMDGVATTTGTAVGIVDPFMTGPTQKGERVYVCLMPGTVTSLRHVWTHPAFVVSEDPKESPDLAFSKKWLEIYAVRLNPYDSPERAYERLVECLRSGEMFAYGSDLHSRSDLEDEDELCTHAEKVLGFRPQLREFSCSC